ncbi:zinc-binding dehydrogenase [Lentzea sp.]|uniref:zinc-binding dehydrogenase n=1 Tax=Lentzea sp. TaxID=56099 RepID=UPI002C37E140|nr:zinc-binding dehydrogenase [Lentzea sp.]HUQ56378.1 zinc-binding dehydrogenase [Lentzea sp.]
MRALITDQRAAGRIRVADVAEPVPAPDEALVRVHAFSVNPGDLHQVSTAPDGTVAGWEASGVVEREAADGSGPARGTHVITCAAAGGWAEVRAVPTRWLGVVPDGVDLVGAATLPVAAGSALRALRAVGPILGRRVLVTGATGAVGAHAVQLAAMGGAEVVAVTRDPAREPWLRELGATEVVTRPSAVTGAVDGVVDNVGGDVLTEAFALLRDGGVLMTVGRAARQDAVLPPDALLGAWDLPQREIRTFMLLFEDIRLDRDLTLLARWVAEGRLRTRVDRVEGLEAGAELIAGGEWTGKLVVRLT